MRTDRLTPYLARLLPLLFALGASQATACRDRNPTAGCCRTCVIGTKPCGDQCITALETCTLPKGCACAG